MTVQEFLAQRQLGQNQRFSVPGARRTVLICSHIWWTELIAHSLIMQGCNVLVAEPWYGIYVNDARWQQAEQWFNAYLTMIREHKVDLIIGGNAAAMLLHPKTGEPLHRAAGVPQVNYWWDELRVPPPMACRGIDFKTYLDTLRDEQTLNAIWDIDILQEMQAYFQLNNTMHLPLATTPEYWPASPMPLSARPFAGCFLGNYHVAPRNQRDHWDPVLSAWAKSAADAKLADPRRPMLDCLKIADPDTRPLADCSHEHQRWGMLACLLMDQNRDDMVAALCNRLGQQFLLVGKNWNQFGLTAAAEHSGIPHAAEFYSHSKFSLNLFGGCVHAGMPLRPYEIAASHGLIFTQFNRELPDLFEPERECVCFENLDQMLEKVDRILASPSEYDGVVQAGRRRVLSQHTWGHRMASLLAECQQRFNLPWSSPAGQRQIAAG